MRKIAAVLLRRSVDFEVRNEKDFLWPKAQPDVEEKFREENFRVNREMREKICVYKHILDEF